MNLDLLVLKSKSCPQLAEERLTFCIKIVHTTLYNIKLSTPLMSLLSSILKPQGTDVLIIHLPFIFKLAHINIVIIVIIVIIAILILCNFIMSHNTILFYFIQKIPCLHVKTTKPCHSTCTLVATSVILRSLKCNCWRCRMDCNQTPISLSWTSTTINQAENVVDFIQHTCSIIFQEYLTLELVLKVQNCF